MSKYTVKLKRSEEVAEDTMAFYFEKPEGFEFKAGQTVNLTLIDPPETDDEGNSRTFTLASAPYEKDLMVATRMRDSAFKRVLNNMNSGTEVKLKGPSGSFTLHNKTEVPAVFITGGIGVTPVRSIILQALKDETAHKLFVFYSNRRPEDAAFLNDLRQSSKKNPDYTLVATMTQKDESEQRWDGETGHIDKSMLKKYLEDIKAPIYYLDGPPDMVEELQKMLVDAEIDEDNIRTEDFPGY